jgi:hypothetical protein
VLAAPLYLTRRRPDLGSFIVRVLAQKLALSVPAFGQRGGLLEMAAVAAVQVLVVGPARILPWAFLAAIFAALQGIWWAAALALSVYGAAVVWALARPAGGRGGPDEARAGWRIGLPAVAGSHAERQ